ncbi:RICIN domain-containing protein [Streptomyces cyaneus]|uniref:RICIN domain-containing protein n=1 Tax=Streptomyces cyaneus TaxID=1904 RepID=UPI000FF8A6AE|nr:RICIN domain-containing protein [Streptomyces cyaneus]
MQVSHPPRPPYPPRPGLPLGEPDPDLVAQLGGDVDERHHATAVLLARHWLSARDYALLCLASATPTAQFVAASAFQRLLDRLASGAPAAALRPQLLVTVRETVRAWASNDRTCAAIPELRKPTGGRGLHAAKPGAPGHRKLAERAFVALSDFSQCLLWHTEVEAEPIEIPAGLLGMETVAARTAVGHAREQFRNGLVRAHMQFAPSAECRFYSSLIDIPIRRGGTLLPDVQQHLTRCTHCRFTADQLAYFDGRLGLLLADAVLGWGGRRYLATRPGRSTPEAWQPAPERDQAAPVTGGRHRTTTERRHRALAAAALASLALLVAVLAAQNWSDDNDTPAPNTPTWGAPANSSPSPTSTGQAGAVSSTSPGTSGTPAQGRLRNLATGMCLAVDSRAAVGAGIRLTACSSAESERWTYEFDGLLRSDADPSLCLAADPQTRNVRLSLCVAHTGEVTYILTSHGELLLRRRQDLALAPDPNDKPSEVVVSDRDAISGQQWALEAA